MAIERGRRQFENMLAFTLILIVMAVFYFWIDRLLAVTERSAIDNTVANMRSAVQIFELSMIVAGRQDSLAEYAGSNPVTLTGMQLHGYVDAPYRDGELAAGDWTFDRQNGELVYQAIDTRATDGAEQLRYRLEYHDEAGQAARLKLVAMNQGKRQ